MANPGYPMQPQMPMGGPPMGRPPMPVPMPQRRGTPKAVPIIVSAGLAVGVFCGLLFGLGTGEAEAEAKGPTEKNFVGTKVDGTDDTPATTVDTNAAPKSVKDGTLVTGTMKEPKQPTVGSAGSAGSAAPAGSAATIAPPAIKIAKITFSLKPDTIKDAKITVDGTDVTNNVMDIPLGDKTKKEVTVVVKASGFKDFEKKLEVEEGELKVEYELVKARSSSGGTTPKRPPPPGGSGKKGDKKKGGGGLIDI